MRIRLTEDKLHQIIYECVKAVLDESKQGLQSKKLFDLIKPYGGFKKDGYRQAVCDVHNLTDNDVIGVIDYDELRRAEQTIMGQGRYRDERGLNAWAAKGGHKIIPGDSVEAIPLNKSGMYVMVIVRNMYQAKGRDGEGWDNYNTKREQRKSDRDWDGSRRFIPKYKRHFEHSRMWKNPWKHEPNWTRQDINKSMQALRDYHQNPDRPTNY